MKKKLGFLILALLSVVCFAPRVSLGAGRYQCQHMRGGYWVVTKDSTCTKTGTKECICYNCGMRIGTGIVEKKAHVYEWKNTLDPSCTKTGLQKCLCKVCKSQKPGTTALPVKALGHRPNINKANCITDKKCLRCGTILEKALGHDLSVCIKHDITTHIVTYRCSRCSVTETHPIDNEFKTYIFKQTTYVCAKDRPSGGLYWGALYVVGGDVRELRDEIMWYLNAIGDYKQNVNTVDANLPADKWLLKEIQKRANQHGGCSLSGICVELFDQVYTKGKQVHGVDEDQFSGAQVLYISFSFMAAACDDPGLGAGICYPTVCKFSSQTCPVRDIPLDYYPVSH